MAKSDTLAKTAKDTEALRAKTPQGLSYSEVAKQLWDAGDVVSASEFGTGFSVLDTKEKGRLVGVPFIILDWQMNEGDNGEFVSLKIVTQADEHLILNDGSTGICRQIQEIAQTGETRAIAVKKGLRRSDYDYTDKDGTKKPATTFYLDTSA